MTQQEASEHYNIPVSILQEYESWGLCGAVKKVMGVWQYDDEDLEWLSTILTLHDIGFTTEEAETYMAPASGAAGQHQKTAADDGRKAKQNLRVYSSNSQRTPDSVPFRTALQHFFLKYVSIPTEKYLSQRENSSLPVAFSVFRYTPDKSSLQKYKIAPLRA